MKRFLLFLILSLVGFAVHAQYQTQLDIALRHLEKNAAEFDLSTSEIGELFVNDINVSRQSGLTNIYLVQAHRDIEAYNGIVNVHINSDGAVHYVASNAIIGFTDRLNSVAPTYGLDEAVSRAYSHLGFEPGSTMDRRFKRKSYAVFEKNEQLLNDLHVKLIGYPLNEQEVRLSWQVQIHHKEDGDLREVFVDASTGLVIADKNLTTYCSFDHIHRSNCAETKQHKNKEAALPVSTVLKAESSLSAVDGSAYKVFPVPAESPAHGSHEVVNEPAHPEASPFGWHDVNGQPGPEFTTLRGNNVDVILDRDADENRDGPGPNGGNDLQFLADFFPDGDIRQNEASSMTNLFYMCNIMHDFTVFYGFDEAWNFQETNYNDNSSADGDYVVALAQHGADDNSGGFRNNASFGTPPDGGNGVMRMFIWDRAAANLPLVNIVAPSSAIAGFSASQAQFGGSLDDGPVEADVILVDDASSSPSLGCDEAVNDLTGQIALIDRGVCEFGTKILNAENRGAVAAIICNFQDGLVTMAGGRDGNQVNIPGVFLSKSDCDIIKLSLGNGLRIRLEVPDEGGPENLIGDFENGIIAHEYGHGISNRLTGGPSASGCLGNTEQMGEGWSDFATLVISTDADNNGDERRGIGTYVTREDNDGQGIRTYPYSTDRNVNPHTYDNIITETVPHGVGSVWNVMCWDLYWAMVDEHGFDEDLYNGTGGNNMAIQLVFEGMKLQKCEPGFIDGRDAILAADEALYDGAHQCLIWQVFAERGLGFNADQGSEFSRTDGLENFDMPPSCSNTISINKQADKDLIEAGETVEISLTVNNYIGSAQSNVVLTDVIPEGATLDESSVSVPFDYADNMLSVELGDLADEEERIITYSMTTSDLDAYTSALSYENDWENGFDGWEFDFDEESGLFWNITTDVGGLQEPFSGDSYWIAYVSENTSIQSLFTASDNAISVPENNPVLRFYHKYRTEAALDGGVVDVSNDGGTSWNSVDLNFFRGAYRGTMQSPAFGAVEAFWGTREQYFGSFVDLSDYAGQNILVRFRLGSETDNETTSDLLFWMLDDVDVFDMVNYNGEVCVTADLGLQNCATMEGRGVIVEPKFITNVEEETISDGLRLKIGPNPTTDQLFLDVYSPDVREAQIRVFAANGSLALQRETVFNKGMQREKLNLAGFASGAYFVEIQQNGQKVVKKILKK